MRSIHDTRGKWHAIFDKFDSTEALKLATAERGDGDQKPCTVGLRSVCWKLFLLFPDDEFAPSSWLPSLRSERRAYTDLRDHYLKSFSGEDILHEAPDVDPLAEDESNPYELYRKDEELRREIFQDIERCMPENTFFRDPATQNSLLNILFVYCKLNQDVSYRQGFHELAAVVFWVVHCDALEPTSEPVLEDADESDYLIREALDAQYIDHDTFAIFQCIMRSAKAWYELGEDSSGLKAEAGGNSPIVLKSKHIHETLLMAVDPELSEHLKALDVLPQVFLIRWIRLLFGREFPLEELLTVWDKLFAEDPNLQLVDLICVAMLLRVRWQLVEADYSTALVLVLRYPSPPQPETLVEDAIYLSDNLSEDGGRHIISKYSKRAPMPRRQRSSTQKKPRRRSHVGSPTRPWLPANQLESIVSDISRNMRDRGEKWGVNRAVREAVVEVRKNMQGYQQREQEKLAATREEELTTKNKALSDQIQLGEERQRHLARMLELSMGVLQNETASAEEKGNAITVMRHVKECLLDPSKTLDKSFLVPSRTPSVASPISPSPPKASFSEEQPTVPSTPPRTRPPSRIPYSPPGSFVKASFKNNSDPDFLTSAQRPRVSLAQSSFAWMLGDDPAFKSKSGFVSSSTSTHGEKNVSRKPSGGLQKDGSGTGPLGLPWSPPEDEGFTLGTLKKKPPSKD